MDTKIKLFCRLNISFILNKTTIWKVHLIPVIFSGDSKKRNKNINHSTLKCILYFNYWYIIGRAIRFTINNFIFRKNDSSFSCFFEKDGKEIVIYRSEEHTSEL